MPGRNGLRKLKRDLARFRRAKATFHNFHVLHETALSIEDAARVWVENYGHTMAKDMKLIDQIRADLHEYLEDFRAQVAIKHKEKK